MFWKCYDSLLKYQGILEESLKHAYFEYFVPKYEEKRKRKQEGKIYTHLDANGLTQLYFIEKLKEEAEKKEENERVRHCEDDYDYGYNRQ